MPRGPASRWYTDLRVCDNPCCGCFHINFRCVMADAAPDTRPVSTDFGLDTEKRCVYRATGCKSPTISNRFAESPFLF
jgi:hypothetical protein